MNQQIAGLHHVTAIARDPQANAALLTAANVARNLSGDTTRLAVARALIALRLGEGTTRAR